MTTLQTADGRLLRSQRPSGMPLSGQRGVFPSMWTSGDTDNTGSGTLASYEQIYRSQPILAGAIDKIARRAATLPFGPYVQLDNGSRTAVAREDGLATLLRRPRPGTSTVHLLAHVFQSLLTHGNALVAKLRSDPEGLPTMLWPLDWAGTGAYGEVGGDIEWWSTTQFGGEERYINVADTIHFAWPGPDGGQIGVSPLEKLGVSIRLEDATQRYQIANFRNGNRPSLAISLEQPKPSKELLAVMRESIDSLHKGVDKAGKTILLGAGATVQPLSLSPVEAALIEQRKLNREEVAIVYDLGGPSLSDITDNSLGNVAERNRAFYRDVLPPWTELVVQTFEAQLIDREPAWMDRVVRFDFTAKLVGEPVEQADALKAKVEAGLMTRNEARVELGLEPQEGADSLTANVNNQGPLPAATVPGQQQ
jgi:HK97 family phage portal protein